MITQILITTLLLHLSQSSNVGPKDEESARKFMQNLNIESSKISHESALANWAYASNITKENLDAKIKNTEKVALFTKKIWEETITYPWQTYQDPDLKRQFKKNSKLQIAALPQEKVTRYTKIISEMQSIYSTAKICSFTNRTQCDLSLEPEIEHVMTNSENPEELKHVWVEWRNASGKKVRKLFKEYVNLLNEAAVLNNFTDSTGMWLHPYEDDNFQNSIKELWNQIQPLYKSIHAYIRNKLNAKYGDKVVQKSGYIPAHLFGNMWAQSAANIFKYVVPFPDSPVAHVTSEMVAQGYTPKKIFEMAEDFFTSINMSAMTEEFWKNSILEKPTGRELICHASAWDFSNGKDFRIKQCTQINLKSLQTAHHEMGHIEYYQQYKDQPVTYRTGANPGFHEAVGDVIALSVSTEKHLYKVGLLKEYKDSYESTINKLMEIAMEKVIFLPYGYVLDLWRWDVFSGKVKPDNYNEAYWKLRRKVQGVDAPVPRSEDDFDPGAKYHVVGNTPYIRYFVSHVIQFQFHKALCEKAGEYEANNPDKALHKCDIYQSTEAGNALARMLQMGASKPWHDAMESLTGQRVMDATALLEYFAPLKDWLDKKNKKNGDTEGWEVKSS